LRFPPIELLSQASGEPHIESVACRLTSVLDLNTEPMSTRGLMRRRAYRAMVLGAVCARTVVQPSVLGAQAPSYFQTLMVPPRAVGTCLEASSSRTPGSKLHTGERLVMTSRAPSARREMVLLRDDSGVAVAFNETVQVSTGHLTSASEVVMATLHPGGDVEGYLTRSEIAMPDPGTARVDTASLRRMRAETKHSSQREFLDVAGQEKVRVLAAWLAKRCRA
jgi:hypothetical protein